MSTRPTLGSLGERAMIDRLARLCGHGRGVRTGIGDDAAVVMAPGSGFDWVLTTDPLVEGVHFLPDAPARSVGHKAAGRVLSDLAAMGADPLWLLVNVVAPAALPASRLESVYRGATALAARFDAAIVGGDLSKGERLELHVFAVGRVPHGEARLRSGAHAGETIYVTGALGGSLAGRHLRFEPRVREGRWLRERSWASAMLDVSDGVATDLPRLLRASGVGAELRRAALPLSAAARRAGDGRPPWEHALCDGEDFELLLTVPARRQAEFERAWARVFPLACTAIGRTTKTAGALLLLDEDGRPVALDRAGYEHFRTPEAAP